MSQLHRFAARLIVVSIALLIGLTAGYALADSHAETETEPESNADAEAETDEGSIKCTLRFDAQSWAFLISKGKGEGEVSCDNGQQAEVVLESSGIGVSLGAQKYQNATGKFTYVNDIEDVFGEYKASGASVGLGGTAGAAGLLKKDSKVRLGMFGTGKGGASISRSWGVLKLQRKPAD
jgi:hypothetical protein